MPNNITPVSAFTSPVQAPADGDAANDATFALAPQALTNRTEHNKDRLDGLSTSASFTVGTSSTTSGSNYTFTADAGDTGDFTLTSGDTEIQVPFAGRWLVIVSGSVSTTDATNPIEFRHDLSNVTSGRGFYGTRYSTDVTIATEVGGAAYFDVATPATELFTLLNNSSATVLGAGGPKTHTITFQYLGA